MSRKSERKRDIIISKTCSLRKSERKRDILSKKCSSRKSEPKRDIKRYERYKKDIERINKRDIILFKRENVKRREKL